MRKILAIRPEPGLEATVNAGREFGLDIRGFALSRIEAVDWEVPASEQFDGLLVGSANVFRHGGSALHSYADLPVLAVGATTAEVAQSHGFVVEKIGEGGLQGLLDSLPSAERHLLRLTGERKVDLDLPANVSVTERVVYRTIDQSLPEELIAELEAKPLILLHSAGSAMHLASECDRVGIARGNLSLAALGPRILDAAGSGWADARGAVNPTETALLALAREMCH